MPRAFVALALFLAVPLAPPVRADDLDPALERTAAVTAGALVLWGGSELGRGTLAPGACRWCDPDRLDRAARDAVRWSDPAAARTASDLLVLAMPLAITGVDLALEGRDLRRTAEDVLVVAEATALAGLATQLVKFSTARRRPDNWAVGFRGGSDADAFVSGHTSVAFAMAGAFGTVARLRGDARWPWLYAGGFTAAAGVGYLRMAGDKHWLTDVVGGAVLGTASGLLLPLLLHRKAPAPGQARVELSLLPLGVAGTF